MSRTRRPPSTIQRVEPQIRSPLPAIRSPTAPIDARSRAPHPVILAPLPAVAAIPHEPIPSGIKNAELRGKIAELRERNAALTLALKALVEAVASQASTTIPMCDALRLLDPKENP